jgi:hypothetical protein
MLDDMVVDLIVLIVSKCNVLEYHIMHCNWIKFLFFNYTSIGPQKTDKGHLIIANMGNKKLDNY